MRKKSIHTIRRELWREGKRERKGEGEEIRVRGVCMREVDKSIENMRIQGRNV